MNLDFGFWKDQDNNSPFLTRNSTLTYLTYSPEGYLLKKDGVEDVNYTYDNFHRLIKVQKEGSREKGIESRKSFRPSHLNSNPSSLSSVEYDYLPTGQRESKLTIDEDRIQTLELKKIKEKYGEKCE